MTRRLSFALAAAALLTAPAVRAQAPAAPPGAPAAPAATPAPPAPEVGQMAPDFSLAWADGSGARATPASISAHKGKVVVLAFYPKDRTTGCTAELTKFRDEYDRLFGKDVVVLPISADGVDSHAAWAKEMNFPFALVADPALTAGRRVRLARAGARDVGAYGVRDREGRAHRVARPALQRAERGRVRGARRRGGRGGAAARGN
jgi:peroxiredoxin Q/BCP